MNSLNKLIETTLDLRKRATRADIICFEGAQYPENADGYGRIRLPHFKETTRSILLPLADAKYFSHAANNAEKLCEIIKVLVDGLEQMDYLHHTGENAATEALAKAEEIANK